MNEYQQYLDRTLLIIKNRKGLVFTFALDHEDVELAKKFKWYEANGYAQNSKDGKTTMLHNLINKTPEGFVTDHEDLNTFNNCRKNLRTATYQQNRVNSKQSQNNNLGFKNVFKVVKNNVPYICTKVGQIEKYFSVNKLGYDKAIEQACLKAMELRKQEYKEFAHV